MKFSIEHLKVKRAVELLTHPKSYNSNHLNPQHEHLGMVVMLLARIPCRSLFGLRQSFLANIGMQLQLQLQLMET